jgi:hypothetical protein
MNIKEAFELWLAMGREFDLKPPVIAAKTVYPDSGIVFCSDVNRPIRRIAALIDCSPFDLFFAKQVLGCDLVVTHHPLAKMLSGLPDMLLQQGDNISSYGTSADQLRPALERARDASYREITGSNFLREEQLARLLDINVVSLHTVADNAGVMVLKYHLDEKKPKTLGETIDLLETIPEYRVAKREGCGPFISLGAASDALGAVALSEFIGGNESDVSVLRALRAAGIQTILCPHFSEEYHAETKRLGMHLIYCGHLASDSIGMNVLLNAFMKRDSSVEVVAFGGLIRP